MVVKAWEDLSPDRLNNQVLFADTQLAEGELEKVIEILES
jgi:hypothetical protein